MLVKIENFKSIAQIEMYLAPLTILVGPPGVGKSNILDAAVLAGYFGRFLSDVYTYGRYEPLPLLIRCPHMRPGCLFTYGDVTKRVAIELETETGRKVAVEIKNSDGGLAIAVNGVEIRWEFQVDKLPDTTALKKALAQPIEARLYGYDRYGLSSYMHGLAAIMKRDLSIPSPRTVLSELGQNFRAVSGAVHEVVLKLNTILRELAGIEVKVLQSGLVAIFDHDYEADLFSVSDSLLRALYYLTAIKTSTNYVKLYKLEKNYVLLLESPDTHMPLHLYPLLAENIVRASQHIYVVLEAHNPLFVSMLWDKAKEVKTYYVARGEDGLTQTWEVDVRKLARDSLTSEDLLRMSPWEVVGKYTV